MADLIQEYELSLWKDVLSADGSHFEEQKIAAIGSNLHTDSIHAYNVTLKENVNGEKTLTFNMLRKYQDENGELQNNPFLSFLAAERKVKFRDGAPYTAGAKPEDDIDAEEKWSDFIIKTVDEDKTSYVNTYTCKEVFVNELGKNGWSVILSSELENNYGTLKELSDRVLEGSGWTVQTGCNPMEKVTEPLFISSNNNFGGTVGLLLTSVVNGAIYGVSRGTIYIPYSQLESIDNSWKIRNDLDKVQVICKLQDIENSQLKEGVTITDFDDSHKIVDENNSYNFWVENPDSLNNISFVPTGSQGVTALQGERIVESIESFFELTLGKYVQKYTHADNLIYHYVENKMVTSATVLNYLTSSNTKNGWEGASGSLTSFFPEKSFIPYWTTLCKDTDGSLREPTLADAKATEIEFKSYICLGSDSISSGVVQETNSIVYNRSLNTNRLHLKPGGKYILRIKGRGRLADSVYNITPHLQLIKGNTKVSNIIGTLSTSAFSLKNPENRPVSWADNTWQLDEQGYYAVRFTLPKENSPFCVALDDLNYTLYLGLISDNTNLNYNGTFATDSRFYIEDIQLFDYIPTPDEKGEIVENKTVPVFPGDVPEGYTLEVPHFYTVALHNGEKVVKELDPNGEYDPVTRANNEAVRSIELKESNYFNNINSLAELFGVWVRFKVRHYNNGKIFYDANGEPEKTVVYSKYPRDNQVNQAGFKYGINIKSIKRNVESNAIASKIIVKDNLNEYANDGLASIRRAKDNYSKENIIYNFDYYIAHGLLDQDTVTRDLYGYSSNDFGYLAKIAQINKKLLPINEQITSLQNALYTAEQNYSAALIGVSEAQSQLVTAKDTLASYEDIYKKIDPETGEVMKDKDTNEELVDEENKNIIAQTRVIAELEARIQDFQESVTTYEEAIKTNRELLYGSEDAETYCTINPITNEITWYGIVLENDNDSLKYQDVSSYPLLLQHEILTRQHRTYDLQFYKKYYRFIQEATWTDSKYIDDDLFYYDAVKVSAQNAWPKTKYTIGVFDIEKIPEFSAYTFKVGQRSYIEDPEFFGYTYSGTNNEIRTPIRKEVVITERSRNFDDPSKSIITIQTYKNQYEDLFSRLNATTTSLQYASGEYQKGANAVNTNGSIAIKSLEQSFAENKFILSSSINDAVSWDSGKGIEVKDIYDALRLVRVTSSGIAMSSDGGENWTTGISASGVNTSALTAGSIAAEHINITSNGERNFVWNGLGISALDRGERYVRFNKHGIYGTDKGDIDETKLLDEANFALTWKGLGINDTEGGVRLSPGVGLKVLDSENNDRVHLGKITKIDENGSKTYYGLVLKNAAGVPTLEQNDEGNLSITGTIYATSGSFTGHIEASSGSFTGTINATDGIFRGRIEANEGYFGGALNAASGNIKEILFGSGSQNCLNDEGIYLNEYATILDSSGLFYGDVLYLGYKGEDEDHDKDNRRNSQNYYLHIGGTNILNAIKSYDAENKPVSIFKIETNGNIVTSGNLQIEGGITGSDILLDGSIKMGSITDDETEELSIVIGKDKDGAYHLWGGKSGKINNTSYTYTAWELKENGSAFFQNAEIQGTITSAVFEYDKTSAVGGTLLVAPSFELTEEQTVKDGKFTYDGSLLSATWENIDKVKIAYYDNGTSLEADATVTYDELTKLYTFNFINNTPTMLYPGTTIMSTSTTVSSIRLVADDELRGPYISIVKQLGTSETGTPLTHQTILGNLSAVETNGYFKNVDGYGLYSDNAYLTGKLYLPNAGITNEGKEEDNPIRIWAGTDETEKEKAPFRVYHDGSVYAANGTFYGNVYAKNGYFSGIISGSTVKLLSELEGENNEENPYRHQSFTITDSTTNEDIVIASFTKELTNFSNLVKIDNSLDVTNTVNAKKLFTETAKIGESITINDNRLQFSDNIASLAYQQEGLLLNSGTTYITNNGDINNFAAKFESKIDNKKAKTSIRDELSFVIWTQETGTQERVNVETIDDGIIFNVIVE